MSNHVSIRYGLFLTAALAACVTTSVKATTTVLVTSGLGHSSMVDSGLTNQDLWADGNGDKSSYSAFGGATCSIATGRDISPLNVNVRNEHSATFITVLAPDGSSTTESVRAGQLAQVGGNRLFVTETFDSGDLFESSTGSDASLPTTPCALAARPFLSTMTAPGGEILQGQNSHGNIQSPVVMPEPTSLLLLLAGGIMLLARRRTFCAVD